MNARDALRAFMGIFLRMLPPGLPGFFYRRILRPAPLRRATNALLLALLPPSIILTEGTLLLNRKDPVISGALALGVYEPFQIRLFRSYLKEGMTVFDIGANIGLYTLLAGKAVGSTGRVIAFEPEPGNAALLRENIKINTLGAVSIEESAVSDRSGMMDLHLATSNLGRHSLVPKALDENERGITVSVPTVRADDMLEKYHLDQIDLIKMDIEGAESLALKGMTRILRQKKLVLFLEFSPSAIRETGMDPDTLLKDLADLNFTLHEIDEARLRISKIENIPSFVASFDGERNTNIICVKQETE